MEVPLLKNLDVKGKKVLMRVDFNVPLDKDGNITDDTRIQAALPSINYVLEKGGSLILMSHLGRPKGKELAYSLSPIAKRLQELLKCPVLMANDCVGLEVEKLASNLKPGQVLLLENLRFHGCEKKPEENPEFAKELANLGDLYVNDAFGAAHRSHSSTVNVVKFFPQKAAAGFLLEKEINFLGTHLRDPERPFCALIGGSKISSKLAVLKTLLNLVDTLLIGGGMAYTFYKALGIEIGESIYEKDLIEDASHILEIAKEKKVALYLPVDNVVVDDFENFTQMQTVASSDGIPPHFQGVDIGPKTVVLFSKELLKAKTIFWNGPLGVYENHAFAKGTMDIASFITSLKCTTIIGGGDSVAAIKQCKDSDKISHLSTGGGAALEYIEQGTLPAIQALFESV